MRFLWRTLGVVIATCFIVVFAALTYAVAKKVWFSKGDGGDQVAVLDIKGVITNASDTIRDVEEMLDNRSVKAIVVRINSPGGLVGPSQEMYEALRRADQKVPVVISMGPLAASGGYYAALGGRKVFANPGTLTASIGVIMELANTEKLYTWAKVERYTIKAGKFKDVGSPLRPMKPEERELLTNMLLDIHKQFRATVKERRKLSDEELDNSADGRVMTGSQAKTAKLVDELGGFQDAVKAAKELAKLPEKAHVTYPGSNQGFLTRFLFGGSEESDSFFDRLFSLLHEKIPSSNAPVTPGWKVMLLAPVR